MQFGSLQNRELRKTKNDPRKDTKRHEQDSSVRVVSCPFVDRIDLLAKVGFFDSGVRGKFCGWSFHNDAASL